MVQTVTPRTPWSKDRDEVLDHKLVWTSRLEAEESILTAQWEVLDIADDDATPLLLFFTPMEAFINNDVNRSLGPHEYSIQFYARNATEGRTYTLKNTITTSQGRTLVSRIKYKCKRK